MSARLLPALLLGLLTGLLLAACGREAPPRAASPTGAPSTQAAAPTADTTGGAPVDTRRALGDPNAPITIIEYSDFQ